MNTTIVFASDVPPATLSDRIGRGELVRLATGVYTSDVTRRSPSSTTGSRFPDVLMTAMTCSVPTRSSLTKSR